MMGSSTLITITTVLPILASAYPGLLSQISPLLTAPSSISVPAPNPNDSRFTKWTAPGPGDVRSPCPGLNALANHNFINHSGKNLTIPDLITGLAAGMNMGADFTIAIGLAGLLSSPNPLGGSFDLNQLDQHNFPIEHDGSLSRRDAYQGNDYSFYQPNFNMVLSHFTGSNTTSIKTASEARFGRINDSATHNPTFTYGPREFILSYGETGLYLQTMSDPYSGVARVDYIKMLFQQEKLPYELGWRPSKAPVTLLTLGQMLLELYAAGQEPLPEGLEVLTLGSYRDFLAGIAAGSELLGNVTAQWNKTLGGLL